MDFCAVKMVIARDLWEWLSHVLANSTHSLFERRFSCITILWSKEGRREPLAIPTPDFQNTLVVEFVCDMMRNKFAFVELSAFILVLELWFRIIPNFFSQRSNSPHFSAEFLERYAESLIYWSRVPNSFQCIKQYESVGPPVFAPQPSDEPQKRDEDVGDESLSDGGTGEGLEVTKMLVNKYLEPVQRHVEHSYTKHHQ